MIEVEKKQCSLAGVVVWEEGPRVYHTLAAQKAEMNFQVVLWTHRVRPTAEFSHRSSALNRFKEKFPCSFSVKRSSDQTRIWLKLVRQDLGQ